jgi:bacterioferritin-associated ferredoxin
MKSCPECGRTLTESGVTEDCGTCVRAEREITELLEEAVAESLIEHVGVNEHGQIVYRRTGKR